MIQPQYRPIKDVYKLKGNPRVIKDKAFKTLCESVKNNPDYFEARPVILSNRTGKLVIIAGNQRYEAAKHLKMTEIPTVLIPDLTEEREREIIIRDNIANGEWDWEALANKWDDLPLADWGLDVPLNDDDGQKIEEKTLRPYNKVHILISLDPSDISEVMHAISTIKADIEVEQSAN